MLKYVSQENAPSSQAKAFSGIQKTICIIVLSYLLKAKKKRFLAAITPYVFYAT